MNTQVVTNNPFEVAQPAAKPSQAMVEVEGSRAIAEIQAAMVIAKKFPRDQLAAMDRIMNACARQSLAEQALYSYGRGGTDVTGPSIRMAEALAQNWGNIQFGIRELEQRNGESTVEAYAWDVETNTRQVKVFQVPHIRHTKKGAYRLEDPRDIYENVANQGARRLRACILGVIPGDVIEAAVKQCELTLRSKVEITPELIKSLLDKFAEFGVQPEQIAKRIQRHLDGIQPAQVVQLGKIYNSLKDGMSVPTDWFEPVAVGGDQAAAATTKTEAIKEKLKARKPDAQAPAAAEGVQHVE